MRTEKETREICLDHLSRWTEHLVSSHSTPILLVGIGHDDRSGELVICTPEAMSDSDIETLLLAAVKKLREGA